MDEEQLREVYEMVDNIPFTRTKKNINRDFSDGVMMAELIQYYKPKSVQLNSYPTVSSIDKKRVNWDTLNTKTLKKLGIGLTKKQIQDIINCVPMVIQAYLYSVLIKFESPAEEVNVRQQIKKSQTFDRTPKQTGVNQGRGQSSTITVGHTDRQTKTNLNIAPEMDLVEQLISEIEDSYAHLLKLQQISKTKDEKIKTLEKRIEKMIFS